MLKGNYVKKILSLFLCCFLCLSGCGERSSSGEAGNVEMEAAVICREGCPIGENFAFVKEGYLYYADMENGEMFPLCSRPSCSHSAGSGCPAALIGQQSGGKIGYGEGKLWFLEEREMGTTKVWCADSDGENATELITVPFGTYGQPAVVYGNKIYLIDQEIRFSDLGEVENMTYQMVSYDLASGEENVLEPERAARISRMDVIGARENWLYYAMLADFSDEYPNGAIFQLNMDTGEKKIALEPSSPMHLVQMGGEGIQYVLTEGNKSQLYFYDPGNGKIVKCEGNVDMIAGDCFNYSICWRSTEEKQYLWNWETDSWQEILSREPEKQGMLRYAKDGRYLFQSMNGMDYYFLTEEELLQE